VTRDAFLESWHFKEENGNNEISRDFGCGYPGDGTTKAWLQNHFDPVFGFPSLVRFSWQTAKTIIDSKGVEVEW
jgi:ribonuclease H2 subunit A